MLFWLPSILTTTTMVNQQTVKKRNEQNESKSTNHKTQTWPLKLVKVNGCFLRGPHRWLTAVKHETADSAEFGCWVELTGSINNCMGWPVFVRGLGFDVSTADEESCFSCVWFELFSFFFIADYISFSAHTDFEQTSEFIRILKPPHIVSTLVELAAVFIFLILNKPIPMNEQSI